METRAARRLLPTTVPHADAAADAGRAALLVHAVAEAPHLLHAGTQDWLHQRYREPAMPEAYALMARLRAAGFAAAISGAVRRSSSSGPRPTCGAWRRPSRAPASDAWESDDPRTRCERSRRDRATTVLA